ncbi:MAG: LysE family translocator [Pseudomonadota bacterium]
MPEFTTLLLFVSASFTLLVVPGPTITLIVSKSVAHGRKVTFPLIAGIAAGGLVATTLALVGVSSILLTSSTAFTILKAAGALYMFYLGIRLLRSRPKGQSNKRLEVDESLHRSFRDGFLVMLFNPKGILFFAAFVPQFIDPNLSFVSQAVVLIVLFVLTGMLVDTGYALLASKARKAIKSPILQASVSKISGCIVIVGAFVALFSRRPVG